MQFLILLNSPVQVGSHGIEASWAGGKRGREVMDRFFPMVPQLLSEQGLFYLVTVSDNNPGRRICEKVRVISYHKPHCSYNK